MSKTWFVTGSSRGLGRSIVVAALEAGGNVYATARRPDRLTELTESYGGSVRVAPLDVTDGDAVRATVADACRTFGSIDVVVNNAGYGDIASVEDVTDADFRAQMETNFYGTYHVSKAAIPVLREQGRGHIIQISSIGGRVGSPGLAAYQAAKWAVEGFSEVLAAEVAPFGVHVTLIEPGAMRTDWAGSSMTIPDISAPYQATTGAMAKMMRQFDGKQTGDPHKIARVIVDLATHPQPPLRLLMGADAYEIAVKAAQDRATSDVAWRQVSTSIAFDSAG